MPYPVRREFETVVTGHSSTTGVAKQDAAESARDRLADVADERVVAVETDALDVYEFPSGPFDPYRISVHASLTVTVDAADETEALATGEAVIDDVLERADLDDVEFVTEPTLSRTAS
jgi:hypothetical protein